MRKEGGPLFTLRDLDTWVTIEHVLDAHEIMDLELAVQEKAREK